MYAISVLGKFAFGAKPETSCVQKNRNQLYKSVLFLGFLNSRSRKYFRLPTGPNFSE